MKIKGAWSLHHDLESSISLSGLTILNNLIHLVSEAHIQSKRKKAENERRRNSR